MTEKKHNPGWLPGPIDRDDAPSLAAAIFLARCAARRPPTAEDAPPSTFPMTDAARAALRYSKEQRK